MADTVARGELALLQHPVAQELLEAPLPAHLAYIAEDGRPIVVPLWFHWNGQEIVLITSPDAPKSAAIRKHPDVTVTIDTSTWPYHQLQIRGRADVSSVDGMAPEYEAEAYRYFGEEQGRAFIDQMRDQFASAARIRVRPRWVDVIDFETRMPRSVT
jgi:PPOX class probable F420-dependent enzyme